MQLCSGVRWVGLCPGDLHNKGYFCEAEVHGSSGFHCILVEIMKRKRLTKDVFKKKKFDDNNLVKVREAIADACRAYGIAAALDIADGITREVVYQVQIPLYAQLGFRNYYTEVC